MLDSAFMAQLLDNFPMETGMTWWIHHGRNDCSCDEFDPLRNWEQGTIESILVDEFVVEIPREASQPAIRHRLPLARQGASLDELLTMASESLRCIDFTSIEEHKDDLFLNGGRASNEDRFEWSRPVRDGESIDFFLSHSWHDDGSAKWKVLQLFGKRFARIKKRQPTFWLDCVCIDQKRIADGLRVLPLFLMACRRVLILCGQTYPTRLWCAWELFNLVGISDVAAERSDFIDLSTEFAGAFAGATASWSISSMVPSSNRNTAYSPGFTAMTNFDVSNAHAYDPNEEGRLLAVIGSIGQETFNQRVRDFSRLLSNRSKYTRFSGLLSRQSTQETDLGACS